MEPVRPLRDVFAELADHAAGPEDAGSSLPDSPSLPAEYHDLPHDLLVTAIGSYAGTAPAEVAEHLAEFVASPGEDLAHGLDLLASAPVGTWEGEVSLAGPDPDGLDGFDGGNLSDLAGVDGNGFDAEDSLDGSDHVDDADGIDDADGDSDPGLHLDDLDSADSLDRTETSGSDDAGSHDPGDDADDTDLDDLDDQPAVSRDFGSDDPTEVTTGNDDTEVDDTGTDTGINHTQIDDGQINDGDDAGVDHTDADQESFTVHSAEPADGHDYLEHQITDHQLADQQADLDDLNDVQDFDEFDA